MKSFSIAKLLSLALICLFFWMALNSLIGDSPIIDEQNHLARGYSFLTTGDPRLNIEHPTLINLLSALPLTLVDGIAFSTEHAGWQSREWYSVASSFFWQDGNPVLLMVFLGRLPIVFLTLFLALAGLRFGNHVWGKPAGLIAFTGILFDPTLFAHGRYITTDLGGTLFIFLATTAVYQLYKNPDPKKIIWAAVGIGLAFASKLTSVVFVSIWLVLAFMPLKNLAEQNGQNTDYWRTVGRKLIHLATAGAGSLVVLWAAFGFEFGSFLFIHGKAQWLNRFSGPMPTFWSGIERITLISSVGRQSFLLGQFSNDGFLAYFPVAFIAKTPLLVLIALFGGLALLLSQSFSRRRATWLLVPVIIYFGSTLTSGLNIGYRHLMPILPFVYLIISGAIAIFARQFSAPTQRWISSVTVALLLFPAVLIHPHQTSFFNLAVGGPENGSAVLVDSNIDWGQDLGRLKAWMDENEVESVNLGWFGTVDPAIYRLNFVPMPGDPKPQFRNLWWQVPFDRTNPAPGVYAISVTSLKEMPLVPAEKTVYEFFRNMEPTDRVGYSILIYVVE